MGRKIWAELQKKDGKSEIYMEKSEIYMEKSEIYMEKSEIYYRIKMNKDWISQGNIRPEELDAKWMSSGGHPGWMDLPCWHQIPRDPEDPSRLVRILNVSYLKYVRQWGLTHGKKYQQFQNSCCGSSSYEFAVTGLWNGFEVAADSPEFMKVSSKQRTNLIETGFF